MTREEHLEWAKQRALAIIDCGKTLTWTSFVLDMHKHEELKGHPALALGQAMFFGGHLSTNDAMRRFIEGFN